MKVSGNSVCHLKLSNILSDLQSVYPNIAYIDGIKVVCNKTLLSLLT